MNKILILPPSRMDFAAKGATVLGAFFHFPGFFDWSTSYLCCIKPFQWSKFDSHFFYSFSGNDSDFYVCESSGR